MGLELFDWAVMATYAAAVLFIGWRVGRGHQTTDELFLGGRRIPMWAAFCSMVATELSAATFIGVPQAAYTGKWFYIQFAIGSLLARFVLATWFLSLYYRLNLTTVYGFLGQRFGRGAELCGSWFFLVGRLFASGTRLFLGALAFAVVTGFRIEVSILIAGAIAVVYTISGGIKAVIWTDTLQGATFLISAIATIIFVSLQATDGLPEIFAAGSAENKCDVLKSVPDGLQEILADGSNIMIAILGGFFLTMATHGTDQDMVQRLLTTSSSKKGGTALIMSGFANFPLTALFLTVGLALWWFDENVAWQLTGELSAQKEERIFPLFVMHQMPVGLRGLIFSGLFAAAMSSMDSALNSLATTWIVDIRGESANAQENVKATRRATLVFGALLIGAALLSHVWYQSQRAAAELDPESKPLDLVSFALSSMTIIYGGLLGAFLVGLLTPSRGSNESILVGMLASALVGVALATQVTWYGTVVVAWPWWIIIGTAITFLVGITSPRRAKS